MEPKIPVEQFRTRVQRIKDDWPSSLDAICLLAGIASDEAKENKTEPMHHWLLGVVFPEIVILMQRSGKIIFWTSAKKARWFKEVEGPEVEVIARVSPPSREADAAQLKDILTALKGDQEKVVVGMLQREVHIGPFAEDAGGAITAFPGFEVTEMQDWCSTLLEFKDASEVGNARKASTFAVCLMQDFLVEKMQEIIDQELTLTHEAVCRNMEDQIDQEPSLERFRKLGLEPDELDITYTSFQSGRQLELKHAIGPNSDNVAMTGTFLLSIGTRCNEYSACLTRTVMVNPIRAQKEAYALALEVQRLIVQLLVPGAVFKDVYAAAKSKVQEIKPELVGRFPKSVGFVMGLEFKDSLSYITATCERQVKAGSVLCIGTGFEKAAAPGSGDPWAVWITDTVLVPAEGGANEVLTIKSSSRVDAVMFELVDELQDAPEPKVKKEPPPTQTAKPKKGAVATSAAKPGTSSKPAAPKASSKQSKEAASRDSRQQKEPPPARSTRSSAASAPAPRAQGRIMESKLRPRNADQKKDIGEQVKLEELQLQLRQEKLQEMKDRFARGEMGVAAAAGSRRGAAPQRLADCQAYAPPACVPEGPANRVRIDLAAEALLVPIHGGMVPFHCRTIKNMSRFQVEGQEYLRINFFTPGQGKSEGDFPPASAQRLYVKELNFQSRVKENFDSIINSHKEVQRRMKHREVESEVKKDSSGTQAQILQTLRSFPCLRDLSMRPNLGSGRRSFGTLEAHSNGFRFSARGSNEKVDIFYNQIAHSIYEPCEDQSLIVLVHFHLKEPIMIGKKRSQDVQFFTEVAPQTEDLSARKSGNAHDPDEILEEQREQEMKSRLNQVFHDFSTKVEAIDSCPVKFDIPFKDLAFFGVPNKSSVRLVPCTSALVSLQEWPPFCLDMDQVEIVVFERALLNLRECDITFVKKDYSQMPVRITTIPSKSVDAIKLWLGERKVIWYTVSMNMNWQTVMKDLTSDLELFLENGGWEGWFGDDKASNEGSGCEDSDGDESDFRDEDEDEDDDDEDGDVESSAEAEEESSEYEADEEEEEGMDWDELEEQAERSDRKRDREQVEARAPPAKSSRAPPAKKPRRR